MDEESILGIMHELAQRNILSPTGKPTWSRRAIDTLLSNEKYRGNSMASTALSMIQHLPIMVELDEKALSAYIMKCVAHKALDYLRKKKHSLCAVELNDRIPAHSDSADSTVLAKNFLEEILQVLTKQQQRVLLLRLEGYNDKESKRSIKHTSQEAPTK